MASLRRKKQRDDAARQAYQAATAGDGDTERERFGAALEEKWAEAWRRARAAQLR